MTAINWTNVTDLSQLPAQANVASNGTFWVGMLYMFWIILLLVTLSFGFEASLLSASFAALVIGILLTYAGLTNFTYVVPFLGILVIYFLYITWIRGKSQ